jgi:hypothetical protein
MWIKFELEILVTTQAKAPPQQERDSPERSLRS